MMELRPYQTAAVEAVYRHLRERDDNPCVVIPTGGGKTPVMATVCRDAVGRWNGRVLDPAGEAGDQPLRQLAQAVRGIVRRDNDLLVLL